MSQTSISSAAQWTGAFLRREWRLIAPVAFAFTALPQLALQSAYGDRMTAPITQFQPWMGWLLPVILVQLIGSLAITALALTPRISVGEALAQAGRRLPVLVAAGALVTLGLSIGTILLLVVLSFVGLLLGATTQSLTGLGVTVSVLAMIVAGTRLLPLPGVVMAGGLGPIASLRQAWALTRGRFWRLLAPVLLLAIAVFILSVAVQQAVGVVAMLIGRATGAEELMLVLARLLLAAVGAAITAAFYVFLAALYRTLAAR